MSTPTQVVQQAYAAFGRGDIEAILAMCTDDIDWQFYAGDGVPTAGRFSGKQQVKQWFGTLAEADEIQQFEPREFLEGADHVTVLGWEQARPKSGSKSYQSDWVHVFKLRGDKVCRWIGTLDTAAYIAASK
jgi:ketosteroid isomerase-like protein